MKNQQEAREQQTREENAKKAKEAAEQLFPGEKWEAKEKGIYQSPHRRTGKKTNYADELRDAQILRDMGSTVYLAPEQRNREGKKYDAIVNGLKMEFKNQHGVSVLTLKDHFLDSREQAPNVFINLENSPLTKRQIIRTLYAARNSEDYAKKSKKFSGGQIILKINGQKNLVYLNVADLEVPGQ
ncbi:MAG: hypothetical protein LBT68_02525 [Spirochaetales bacterium]|nr:hypothetical protein [Spirochaetales bacterium]